jgi:hypothetical protein
LGWHFFRSDSRIHLIEQGVPVVGSTWPWELKAGGSLGFVFAGLGFGSTGLGNLDGTILERVARSKAEQNAGENLNTRRYV